MSYRVWAVVWSIGSTMAPPSSARASIGTAKVPKPALTRAAGGCLMKIRAYVVLATVALFAAPTVSWAGTLTCLTGTNPSVANDVWQVTEAREIIEFLGGCGCQTQTPKAFLSCEKKNIDSYINGGLVRRQCRSTLIKEFKQTAKNSSRQLVRARTRAPCRASRRTLPAARSRAPSSRARSAWGQRRTPRWRATPSS